MHVAYKLGKTVKELYEGLDSPAEIGEWLAFFGNPHILQEEPQPQKTAPSIGQKIRAGIEMHNANIEARKARNGGKNR